MLPIKKQHVHKIKIAAMRMFIWTCGKTRLDNIRIKRIWEHLEIASIGEMDAW